MIPTKSVSQSTWHLMHIFLSRCANMLLYDANRQVKRQEVAKESGNMSREQR
jgi:hypothetical protein